MIISKVALSKTHPHDTASLKQFGFSDAENLNSVAHGLVFKRICCSFSEEGSR